MRVRYPLRIQDLKLQLIRDGTKLSNKLSELDDNKDYIKGIELFWSLAKKQLISHQGISRQKLLDYIKLMR